jgi:DNA-directed RNA polymerase specialized sigma subunit
MGVGNYVKGSEHDSYESIYALNTPKGVGRLLKDMHKLHSRAYEQGDYAAIDILVDMEQAIEKAELTDRQDQAVDYLYRKDFEQGEAAKELGVDGSTLSRHRKAALTKIAAVYREWNYI